VDSTGTPVCTYTNRTDCVPANACEVVDKCVEDGQPYACNKSAYCVDTLNDPCTTLVCNISASGVPSCNRIPALNCNDLDPCTNDTCSNGTCIHTSCITTDPCVPNVCNVSVGCVLTPVVCNDRNLCTEDLCINGTCNFNTPTPCPSPNFCTIATCVSTTGCQTTARNCLLNGTCYSQENGALVQYTPCTSLRCGTDQTCIDNLYAVSSNTDCDVFVCANSTCLYTVQECPQTLSTTAIVAGGIAAGVLAGIIIAAVLCAGLCGGGVFAVVNAAKHDNQSEVYNNPLFKGLGQTFDNPINKKTGDN